MVARRRTVGGAGPVGRVDPIAALAAPVAALALLLATALRLSGRTVWGSSSVVAFTPAMALGAGVLSGLSGALGRRRSAAVLGASATVLAVVIAPRARATPLPAPARADAPRLTVLSANCLEGRADPDALVALVRELRPDVVALQEQNPRFIGKLDRAGLFELLPHRVLAGGGRLADGGLVARHPLTPIRPELASEFVTATMALPGGASVPLISFHPLPPVGRRATRRWTANLADIPSAAGEFARGIVAGDFNATHDHPEFRAVLARGWRDAGAERGAGLRATWSAHGILRLSIDHILAPPGAQVLAYEVHRLRGSDHRAVSAVVALPG